MHTAICVSSLEKCPFKSFVLFSFSEKNVYYLFTWLHWVLVVAGGIFSCGMWDLGPWLWIEPGPSALGAWSLSCWTTWEVPHLFFLILLFIYGCAGSSLLLSGFFLVEQGLPSIITRGAGASHWGGFSHGGARALGCAGFSSCSEKTQSLWFPALEHRLNSCGTQTSLLYGIWNLPRPGLCLPPWQTTLHDWVSREAPSLFFLIQIFIFLLLSFKNSLCI